MSDACSAHQRYSRAQEEACEPDVESPLPSWERVRERGQPSQPCQIQLTTRSDPRTPEQLFGSLRTARVTALLVHLAQSIQRPTIVRRARETFTERHLGAVQIAVGEQRCAERLAHRVIPVRRLHVWKLILVSDRGAEVLDR